MHFIRDNTSVAMASLPNSPSAGVTPRDSNDNQQQLSLSGPSQGQSVPDVTRVMSPNDQYALALTQTAGLAINPGIMTGIPVCVLRAVNGLTILSSVQIVEGLDIQSVSMPSFMMGIPFVGAAIKESKHIKKLSGLMKPFLLGVNP